ncbi:MAG: molybdate ABC transporter substrate-binding protein [Alphaproteobacteria bacterium]
MSYIRRYITVLISSPRPPGRALAWFLTRRVRGWWIGAAVGLALASPAHAEQVLILAAASTTDAMTEIIDTYEIATGVPVAVAFGASSALARQVESGAPAHLYLSANAVWMDYLEDAALILAASRVDLLANRLALVAPADSPITIAITPDLPLVALLGDDGRLALGDPDHVPAGLYARAALEHLGLWSAVVPRLVRSANVRAALVLVERGEVPLGIVYATDALVSDGVRTVATFPTDSHPPIRYPLALVTGLDTPAARAFHDYLSSDAAAAIFTRHGFTSP